MCPRAAPGVPLKAIKWMFQRHAPLAIRFDGSSFQLNWMWQMLKNCNTEHYMTNKGRMVRTAEYSRDCIKALRQETGIQYEGRRAARCSCSAPSNSSKTQRKTLRYWKMPGCLTNCWRPASSPALSRRWPVAHKLTGGLPAERRDRRLPAVYATAGEDGRAGGRDFSVQPQRRSSAGGGRQDRRRAVWRGSVQGR